MTPHQIRVHRRIRAARDSVFAACTSADALRSWLANADLEVAHAEIDPRAGGTLRVDVRAPATGHAWTHTGEVLEVRAAEKLAFAWRSEATRGERTVVTIELADANGATDVVLTHANLPDERSAREHADVWGGRLDALAKHAGDARAFDLPQAIEILRATPRTLDALLGGVSGPWLFANEGGATFHAHAVVGHLIHGERTDWIPRVKRILEHGESLSFEPFDRFAARREERTQSTRALLDLFGTLRGQSLAELEALKLERDDFARRGRHPAFGTVTLGELLATWVVHDLDHLGQIARVMAKRYANDVGPWKTYLPIVTR